MEELQRQFSETVCLALRKEATRFYTRRLWSSLTLRMVATVGSTAPLHASALGKALSANLPEHEMVALVLSQPMPRYTARTITDGRSCARQLRLVPSRLCRGQRRGRGRGPACRRGLRIFRHPLGGISISGPTNRMRTRGRDGNVDHGGAREILRDWPGLHISMAKR